MSDVNDIIAGGIGIATIFKSVLSGISGLQGIKDKKRQAEIVTHLLDQIITLQNNFITTQAVYEAAKEKAIALEQWAKEKSRYRMERFAPGIVLYAVNPEYQGAEPHRYICPNCYNDIIARTFFK